MHWLALELLCRLRLRWRVLTFVLAVCAWTSSAFADEGTEPIHIEYRAVPAAGCPSESEFESKVFARTASARPAEAGEPARTFIVELRRTGGRISGSLVIQETDGATMARRVNGAECADVATVLALATALAIDPRAELAPDQTLDDTRDMEEPGETPAVDYETPAEPAARHAQWIPRWALGATAAFAVAPGPAFGASLSFSWHRRRAPPIGELGVELVYRQTRPHVVRDASALFHFYAARPTVCVTSVEFGSALSAAPCLVFEAGGVTGVGSEIPNSAQRTRFWATGEALLRFELDLGTGEFITLEGGVASPLTRYRFVFRNPETSIHQVPAVTATLALRIGTNF